MRTIYAWWNSLPFMAPEGGSGGGGYNPGGAGAGAGGGGAGGGAPAGGSGGAGGDRGGSGDDKGTDTPVTRADGQPSWLPEKFKDPQAFADSYKELERTQFKRRDDLRTEVRGEIEAERKKTIPVSPGDYTFEAIKLKDGKEIRLNDQDPLLPWIQDRAHKLGLTNEQYQCLIGEFVQQDLLRGPKWDDEVANLGGGDQAEMRLKRIEGFMRGNAPQEVYDTFASIPATAGMVKLFEHVMTLAGEPVFKMADDGSDASGPMTREKLKEMQADPRYWKTRDPLFVKQVQAGFRRLAAQR